MYRVGARLHVDGDAMTGLDEIYCPLGITFVSLTRIGKPHRNEKVTWRRPIEFICGNLGQLATGTGIDASANTQDQRLQSGRLQLGLDEIDPPTGLDLDLNIGQHLHFGNYR